MIIGIMLFSECQYALFIADVYDLTGFLTNKETRRKLFCMLEPGLLL